MMHAAEEGEIVSVLTYKYRCIGRAYPPAMLHLLFALQL